MRSLIWLALAWVGGAAAILGSLMTLGSLLLWLVPNPATKSSLPDKPLVAPNTWRTRARLLLFSLALAFVGFKVLLLVPFSSH
ncbi:MAG: hypothetical protein IGS48_10250 [Oscillatoriales cyanobacterium C42_A2020_001]|nr:hypothetical protein [Leptolyngbyaceae cyanobacterium C42_A2020_001]